MTPPRTFIGSIALHPLFERPLYRRLLFAVLIAILLVLAFFPERYRSAVTMTPSDPSTLGFNPAQIQLSAIGNVFGNQTALEVAMRVAGSVGVRDQVIKDVKLAERLGEKDREALHRWLERNVDIRSLRGGIIQIQMLNSDGEFAKSVVAAYEAATRAQLARIFREQASYKQDVLLKLVTEASDKVAVAQSKFDGFRLATRTPDPAAEASVAGARVNMIRQSIRRKEIELSSARQIYSDSNVVVRQLASELATLRGQLAEAQATSIAPAEGVGRAIQSSSQYMKLQREVAIAQSLYETYLRLLEGASVDDMTSSANIRVLEPPFIDTSRQINKSPLALAIALLLIALAIEFYRLRPAVGERVTIRESHA